MAPAQPVEQPTVERTATPPVKRNVVEKDLQIPVFLQKNRK